MQMIEIARIAYSVTRGTRPISEQHPEWAELGPVAREDCVRLAALVTPGDGRDVGFVIPLLIHDEDEQTRELFASVVTHILGL